MMLKLLFLFLNVVEALRTRINILYFSYILDFKHRRIHRHAHSCNYLFLETHTQKKLLVCLFKFFFKT